MNISQLRLLNKMRHFANYNITPLNLNFIWNYGKSKHLSNSMNQSLFLHKELPIRLSQRAIELESLPYSISDTSYIQNIYSL